MIKLTQEDFQDLLQEVRDLKKEVLKIKDVQQKEIESKERERNDAAWSDAMAPRWRRD